MHNYGSLTGPHPEWASRSGGMRGKQWESLWSLENLFAWWRSSLAGQPSASSLYIYRIKAVTSVGSVLKLALLQNYAGPLSFLPPHVCFGVTLIPGTGITPHEVTRWFNCTVARNNSCCKPIRPKTVFGNSLVQKQIVYITHISLSESDQWWAPDMEGIWVPVQHALDGTQSSPRSSDTALLHTQTFHEAASCGYNIQMNVHQVWNWIYACCPGSI